MEYHGTIISSEPAWITVEGLSWASNTTYLNLLLILNKCPPLNIISAVFSGVPHFVVEPSDVAAFAGEPFNLTCAARGPPDPVEVLWWLGGEQKGDFMPSPSVLFVKGEMHQSLNQVGPVGLVHTLLFGKVVLFYLFRPVLVFYPH